ncbi:hypothetical protein [Janthinobacterium sp. EB271-G4-7A]|uniref:hypothetical protein n=1 Tax=Janthinobacterium sp. EB271-G4-7A TaxID=2775056 RepID=UPI001E5A4C47|nr:hypothetical protein [Janthinobacterium sp. EB271-G4-7A]MCC7695908.1 hypothetical protein [Janthinobacterium sp. EB271-G4-7A]
MPRRLRLVLPGVPLHVMQRGVNRQACFLDGQDDLLSPHSLYWMLGHDASERQKTYQSLFQDALGERCLGQLREAINAEFAVGDQAFLRRVTESIG